MRADLRNIFSEWSFDEGQGTVTFDAVSANNGSFVSIPQSNWIDGVVGTALLFQARVDPALSTYLNLAATVVLQSQFTLNFWTYGTAPITLSQQSFSGFAGLNTQAYVFSPAASFAPQEGFATLYVAAGSNGVAVFARTFNAFSPILVWAGDVSGWTMVTVIVRYGAVSLFINGSPVSTVSIAYQGLLVQMLVDTVGANPRLGGFSGGLDEVRLYNSSLVPSRVQSLFYLYQLSSAVLHYAFDEGSGQVALNDGTYAFENGILQGMDDSNRVAGVVGGALNFTAAYQFVDVQASAPIHQNFTLCLWAIPASNATAQYSPSAAPQTLTGLSYAVEPVYDASLGASANVGMSIDAAGVTVVAAGSAGTYVLLQWTPGMDLQSWLYYCVSVDNGLASLYVNGQFVGQGVPAPVPVALSLSNIGGVTQFYAGAIDELRVFAARLTGTGIQFQYQADVTADPGTLYHFDESGGNTTVDAATGVQATILGARAANWVPGAIGPSAIFFPPALSQYIQTGHAASYAQTFTVAFWAQPANSINIITQGSSAALSTLSQQFVLGPPASTGPAAMAISIGTSGVVVLACLQDSCTSLLSFPAVLLPTVWTFIAVTVSKGQPLLYVNGVQQQVGMRATGSIALNTDYIGYPADSTQSYRGALDELQIWSRALQQADVASAYTLGIAVGTGNNLVAFYPFSEGQGTSTADDRFALVLLRRL